MFSSEDSESEEVLEELHIPEVPNKICFIIYTPDDTLWLSMGGYDAGYIYEYKMTHKHNVAVRSTMVYEADDIELHEYLYSYDILRITIPKSTFD